MTRLTGSSAVLLVADIDRAVESGATGSGSCARSMPSCGSARAPIDYTIYDAPHGFREFGVTDPDGHDIAFGQRRD